MSDKKEPVNGEAIVMKVPTPLSIMQIAVQSGQPLNVETMTQLFALHREMMADEARRAFEQAFAAFKAEAPKLQRTREVSFGQGKTAYKFTPLDEIANTLGPALAKHGLSYNWRQESSKEGITVTCVLRHVNGHSTENTLGPAGADTSGSKNAIQAMGSAVSYLRRYTLLGVLGMATGDEDTDGITMGNATDFVDNIRDAQDMGQLEARYKEAIREAVKLADPKAAGLFKQAMERRRKELAA